MSRMNLVNIAKNATPEEVEDCREELRRRILSFYSAEHLAVAFEKCNFSSEDFVESIITDIRSDDPKVRERTRAQLLEYLELVSTHSGLSTSATITSEKTNESGERLITTLKRSGLESAFSHKPLNSKPHYELHSAQQGQSHALEQHPEHPALDTADTRGDGQGDGRDNDDRRGGTGGEDALSDLLDPTVAARNRGHLNP